MSDNGESLDGDSEHLLDNLLVDMKKDYPVVSPSQVLKTNFENGMDEEESSSYIDPADYPVTPEKKKNLKRPRVSKANAYGKMAEQKP